MSIHPLLLHINYFEQGQDIDRAFELTRELGADGLELRRKPAAFTGTDLEYLDTVSTAFDKYPLNCLSFGGPGVNMISPVSGDLNRELDEAEAFYRKAAKRFPLSVVNMLGGNLINSDKSIPYLQYASHGSAVASDAHWESSITGFRRLSSLGQELGIRFAFETHGTYLHDTIEATMKLVKAIDSDAFGVCWDQANLAIFPESPSFDDALSAMGNKLYYVHLKNLLVPPSRFLAVSSLASGIINVRQQMQKTIASGFTGPICIESPRPGDRETFAREDLAYLKSLC